MWQPEFTDKTLSRKTGAVQTGKRVVSVQKDGRRIEYTAASLDELNRAINDAESVLGTTRRRRRPLGVRL
ncbi:gpW family protein [Escherichia coli]|nr:gpW family protein [Escherichia coli]MCM4529894.1 gpW family protein [Escherichia coli]MCM4540209.1 gpW family protein [Escherichia coli]